jgi:hypothetical protein
MYFHVSSLRDGTVLAAYPVRKPSARVLKRDGRRIDADNVCQEFSGAGRELSDVNNDTRTRFQDIIANSLNLRRAVRSLLLPRLQALESELAALHVQLDRVEQVLVAMKSNGQ